MLNLDSVSSLTMLLVENSGESPFSSWMLPGMIAIFIAYFFIILRPQKKQETDRKKMLKELNKGDNVQTVGGIMGRVMGTNKESDTVTVEIDHKKGVCIEINRASIYSIKDKKKGGPKGKQQAVKE